MSYFEFLAEYFPKLAGGAWVTVLQLICSALLAAALSVFFGILRLSRSRVVNGIALVYIEFFRGTSLLVQLFWIYYVLPLFGFTLSSFEAGFVALGLNFGAYGAEIVRGAIQSVPKAQWEATIALNMSPALRMRRSRLLPVISSTLRAMSRSCGSNSGLPSMAPPERLSVERDKESQGTKAWIRQAKG